MKIKVKTTKFTKIEAEILALFVTADNLTDEIKSYDLALKKSLSADVKYDNFTGKLGEIYTFYPHGQMQPKTIVLVGVGKKDELDLIKIREASGSLMRYAKARKRSSLVIDLTNEVIKSDSHNLAKTITEGLILGDYKFNKYKNPSKEKISEITDITLIFNPAKLQHAVNGVVEGQLMANAVCFARNLINEPAAVTTPSYLVQVARGLAKKDDFDIEVLDEAKIKKLGMEAYLAVAKGSSEPPKFIKLVYKGAKSLKTGKKLTLVGKTITFDSGGLSLKDGKGMETMKIDMSGGAAILGIFSVITKIKPKINLVGIIPACENMPGPSSCKPGDIVTTYNKKTVEIVNTDAEGRLVLADVLAYTENVDKPNYIIDIATLTGACMVALGQDIAGVFSNNADLTQKLFTAAKVSGEKYWELPLDQKYLELIQGDITDLKNVSKTRYGGAITAALFLQEFIQKTPWLHIDIAGPAYAEKDTPLNTKGGVGFGVMSILELLKKL